MHHNLFYLIKYKKSRKLRSSKNEQAVDFKQSVVLDEQKKGNKVIFIGDGRSDLHAAKVADVVFAVENSVLAKQQNYKTFQTFHNVVNYLQDIL